MTKIDPKQKLKAYLDGINEELVILDAERQRRMTNIRIYLKEIGLIISEL